MSEGSPHSTTANVMPTEGEAWPKFSTQVLVDLTGDDYDIAREDLFNYAQGKPLVWPTRELFFLCDVHADTDALFRAIVACGAITRTGDGDDDFELTDAGRHGLFVFGGDCFDKGPDNLRLLDAIKGLMDRGAEVVLLAGNHDVRAFVGLSNLGQKEPHLAHLFVRMGQKAVPLFQEVYARYGASLDVDTNLSEAEVDEMLFPPESWWEDFPRVMEGRIRPARLTKELRRIREKVHELRERWEGTGLSMHDLLATARKARQLFMDPDGDYHWFFSQMKLAYRHGSCLLVHAGVDDISAGWIREGGVKGLNARFRELLHEDLFELYHGPLGNTFRTKYRDMDLPLTEEGVRNMHHAGIYIIAHGHRNVLRGQRLVMRAGILNVECDASVDCNTRANVGLAGPGGAVTIFRPDAKIIGISTDYPYAKVFDVDAAFNVTTFS